MNQGMMGGKSGAKRLIETQPVVSSTRRAWLLVGFMWVAFFINYSDRQVVYSLFPVLKSELQFTDIQLGLLGSLFQWFYSFCSPIAGQVGDRFCKRVIVVVSLCLWSIVTLFMGMAGSAQQLIVCQILLAITQPFFAPVALTFTANAHSPRTRSRAIALFATAQLAGVVMGGWYGGFVAQELHWRLAFCFLGTAGLIYALPYWKFLRGAGGETLPETKKSGGGLAAIALMKVPSYLFLGLALSAFSTALALWYNWLPNFFYEKFSLSLSEAGFTATVYLQSATLVGLLSGGGLADWLYTRTKAARQWVLCAGLLVLAPFLHLLGTSNSLLFTKAAAIGCGLGSGLFIANLMVSSFEVVPADTRVSAAAILNFISGIFSGLTSLLAGAWKAHVGISSMMTYSAVICAAAGLLLILGIRLYFQRDYERVH